MDRLIRDDKHLEQSCACSPRSGGTFTNIFAVSFRDLTIVDNGDGTTTITTLGTGGSRYYDADGNFVLKDPGQIRFAVDFDLNGTPGDPSDDFEIPGSFRIVRSSTGHSDLSDRNFCADLVEFTSYFDLKNGAAD